MEQRKNAQEMLFFLTLVCALLTGCTTNTQDAPPAKTVTTTFVSPTGIEEVSADEVSKNFERYKQEYALVDVRETEEYAAGRIPGTVNIPLSVLKTGKDVALDKSRAVLTVCNSGVRSIKAAQILKGKGYKVKSMEGGMNAWKGPTEK